jgi:hypothetical protein
MNNLNKTLIGLIVVALIAALAWSLATMPDRRSTGQRIGDAVDALPDGVDKAADQLGDRTPAERIGDSVKKTVDE